MNGRVLAAITALAACLVVAVTPPAPLTGSEIQLTRLAPDHRLRSASASTATRGQENGIGRGEQIVLWMTVGEPSRFDRLIRGAEPWAALVSIDARGQARLVCTYDTLDCHAGDGVMSHAFKHEDAVRNTGEWRFGFVSGSQRPDRVELDALLKRVSDPVDPSSVWNRLVEAVPGLGASLTLHDPVVVKVKDN